MPPHVKWPSIVSFHNVRKTLAQYPELTNGDSRVVYRGKVKLHGTNAAIQFHDGVPYAQSRTQVLGTATNLEKGNDNAGFRRWLHRHKKALVSQAEAFKESDINTITVFGEWAGCLEHGTKILLANGATETIGKIVNNKLEAEVLSYNLESQRFEPKKITGWLRRDNVSCDNNWLTINVRRRKRGGREHRLVLTGNHLVFTKRNNVVKEVRAEDLKVGDILLTPGKKVSYHQIQFMMGSLLGDGSFDSYGHFITSHSEDSQKDYLDFIQELLKEVISSSCSRTSGHGSNMLQINTISLPEIKSLQDSLIKGGKKMPGIDYLNKLHPPALAAWYMDDGNLVKGKPNGQFQCELNTQGFGEGNEIITDWFNSHGYECYVCKTGIESINNKFYIRFTPRGAEAFLRTISPYVIKSFNYKLPKCFRSINKVDWLSGTPLTGLVETPITSIKKGNPYSENWRNVRYDIEVEDNHNFIANNILVHNSGIQKGCSIHQVKKPIFAIFAMIESNTNFEGQTRIWSEPSLIELALTHLLDQVPEIYVLPWEGGEITVDWTDSAEQLQSVIDLFNKEVERVETCDPWVKETFGIEGTGEGLVYYPVSSRHNSRDDFSNLGFKAKGDKHKVVKTKKAVQVDPEVAASMLAFVEMVCTEARLEQGVAEACGGEYIHKKIGPFVGWVASDIKKECEAELQAAGLKWKPTAKVITNYARSWYLKKIETT